MAELTGATIAPGDLAEVYTRTVVDVGTRMFDDEGNITKISFPKKPDGHRSFYINRSKIERAFDREGIIAETQIGNSYTQMIPIRSIIQVTLERLSKEPDILLCDNPVCDFCVSEKNEILAQKDVILQTIAELRQELSM